MAQNGGDKEDKFDAFTSEGESLGYISLEQARVLAMQHARDNRDFYGPAYSRTNLVWEVTSEEEGEDYYDIRLSFRPAGRFRGEPGVEQFIIGKTGNIDAAIATGDSAFRLKLYEVSKFMVGPIQPVRITWLTMNRDQWNALPVDIQEIIREEASSTQEKNLRLATIEWLKQEIQDNVDQ